MGKSRNKISNWSQYNKSLINRGSITFWMDDKAITNWINKERHGGRGRSNQFSELAIETSLTLKSLFNLPLRATEEFINSIFSLMGLNLASPGYSCMSKRAKTVNIQYKRASTGAVSHVVVDATGLKIFGEGEWKTHKHGREKRRRWRKLHLAVDASTHDVIAAQVSLDSVGDNRVLPLLLNPLRRTIKQVSADGAYDTKACHELIKNKKAKATIPPRANAGFWGAGHPRNVAVEALKEGNLTQWKKDNDYHQRSLSETAMSRFKSLVSAKLSLRNYDAQIAEALVGVKIINKVIDLGMPIRQGTQD